MRHILAIYALVSLLVWALTVDFRDVPGRSGEW